MNTAVTYSFAILYDSDDIAAQKKQQKYRFRNGPILFLEKIGFWLEIPKILFFLSILLRES